MNKNIFNTKSTYTHHERKATHLYFLCKATKAILWYPHSNFFFEAVYRGSFFYLYRKDSPNFGAEIGDTFRNIINCSGRVSTERR